MRALLLLATLSINASAKIEFEREEYKIVGWNNACSVAVERVGFPKFGQAPANEPITTRIGTLSVIIGQPIVETRWVFEGDGTDTYNKPEAGRIRKKLRKAGYDRPGFTEIIRDAPVAVPRGSVDVILSTAILEARPDFWPDTGVWRWGRTHYNPLSTCALLVYEKNSARDRYKFILTRIFNASARTERARAHTTNGRLLLNGGDLVGALAETEIGARTAPDVAATRYHYAALLALNGRLDDAMRELLAATKLNSRFAGKAAGDMDFDSLRNRQDFQELIIKAAPPSAPGPEAL